MKKRILVVDDDPTIMNFLAPFFSKKQYDSDSAENGEEAFEKIKKSPPDLIISDIIMPRMDGFELYRRLREDPETETIPFIFLSSKDDPSDQLKGFRMGADEYVTKPFDLQHLFETIKKVMADADKTKSSVEKIDFGGNLTEVNLEDIIQIIEMNQKTGELIFVTPQDKTSGSIFFKDGGVIHATTDKLEGEEAFYDLSAINEGYAKFFVTKIDAPETISAQTMALLFEAARMKDEGKTLSSVMDDLNAPLWIKSRKIPSRIKEILGEKWISEIIQLIERKKTATEIINGGGMSRSRVENILVELMKAGIIQAKGSKQASEEQPVLVDEALIAQLYEIESSALTGALEIEGRQIPAIIFFDNGRIDQAHYGNQKGKKALFKIFSEKGGTLTFKPKNIIIEGAIQSDLTSLLSEADKEIRYKQELTDDKLNRRIVVKPDAFKKIASNKKGPDWSNLLNLAVEKKIIRDILEASPLTELKTINRLILFKKLGLVNIERFEEENADKVEQYKSPTIRIVTDSSADLPPELLRAPNLVTVPFEIQFGKQFFIDGMDLTAQRFYELMSNSSVTPRAYAATENEVHAILKKIIGKSDILGIFISKYMSNMHEIVTNSVKKNNQEYSLLRKRKLELDAPPVIEVIDSKMVSMGLGLLIAETLDKIDAKWPIDKIRQHIENLIPKVRVIFMVNTLDLLISDWQMLEVKPVKRNRKLIIGIQKGTGSVEILDQAKDGQDGRQIIERLIRDDLLQVLGPPIRAAVMHGDEPEWAEKMAHIMMERFRCDKLYRSRLGPAVGAHLGLGAAGVAYFPLGEEASSG